MLHQEDQSQPAGGTRHEEGASHEEAAHPQGNGKGNLARVSQRDPWKSWHVSRHQQCSRQLDERARDVAVTSL